MLNCYCCGNLINDKEPGLQGIKLFNTVIVCDNFCAELFHLLFKKHLHKPRSLREALLLRELRHSISKKIKKNDEYFLKILTEKIKSKK